MAYKSKVWDGTAWQDVANSISKSATGGGGDSVFFENDQIITTSYTISAGKNAMTAGPVTILSGITITILTGSVWTIV